MPNVMNQSPRNLSPVFVFRTGSIYHQHNRSRVLKSELIEGIRLVALAMLSPRWDHGDICTHYLGIYALSIRKALLMSLEIEVSPLESLPVCDLRSCLPMG